MAHFLLTPVGSSGDVHPFVGIGRALRARGHEVTLITAEPFRAVAGRAGLRFVGTHSAEDFDALARHPDLWNRHKGLKLVLRAAASIVRVDYDRIAEAYEPGRTVLVAHALAFAARVFQDVNGATGATLQLAPSVFRSEYRPPAPWPGWDASGLPRWIKRSLWWLVDRLMIDPNLAPELNRFRRELGLRPVSRIFNRWLHSPQRVIGLFPDWFGPPQPDWPQQVRLTTFPLYDESEQHPVDPALQAFLDGGTAPILFTPGSANRAAQRFFEAAVDAAHRLQRRALLLTSYRDQVPRPLPPTIRHEPYVPLSQVLPRCAAIVHHGGIGTCAQGLAAGVPQLTMPLGFDQPDNATRLWKLGVGRWVMPERFTGRRVADTLEPLLRDDRVAERCQHWAVAIRSTDPTAATCALLEELAPNPEAHVSRHS